MSKGFPNGFAGPDPGDPGVIARCRKGSGVRTEIWICLFLAVVTLSVYRQVRTFDFINFDDNGYVYENPKVSSGLSLESLRWALTTSCESNWHPVTWISHMGDCEIYGLAPGSHHMTNLFVHILNSLLLFLILRRITGAVWRSALVAAIFAVHPLQVESVAWISERKNLLCGLFWMLTLLSYAFYVEKPTFCRYLGMAACFALGVMAKPMIVTLPFVLLLLDYWPLCRIPGKRRTACGAGGIAGIGWILEKLPLLALSALSCAATWSAQNRGGAVIPMEAYPLGARAANAVISYSKYLLNTIWPSNLAVFYPLPEEIDSRQALLAAILLASVTIWVVKNRRHRPYALVGWFWFAGTLIPVAGLVQVGSQAMADRYMYLPMIGLAIGACWGIYGFSLGRKSGKRLVAVSAAAAVAIFSTVAWIQTGYWKDSTSLFSRALETTSGNYVAHNNLGLALKAGGDIRKAAAHYSESLRINPNYAVAQINLGNVLAAEGDLNGAASYYRMALQVDPEDSRTYKNLGTLLVRMEKPEEALPLFRKAIELDPDYPDAHSDLGVALAVQGRISEAAIHFREALRIAPGHEKAARALALAAKNSKSQAPNFKQYSNPNIQISNRSSR